MKEENDYIVIGMSPGNGYFKQEVIDNLLSFTLDNYKKVDVFIPDIPAISTYIALGYSENLAKNKKAIPQGNNFKNRIKNSIKRLNLDSDRLKVFDWDKENIESNIFYKNSFDYIFNLYKSNYDFHNDINKETEKVLQTNKFKKKEIAKEDVEIGAHYILSEFAFIDFLHHAYEIDIINYGYHREWAVWEDFILGKYDSIIREKYKFILLPDFSK